MDRYWTLALGLLVFGTFLCTSYAVYRKVQDWRARRAALDPMAAAFGDAPNVEALRAEFLRRCGS